ncbi:MAG TPA: AAA family ATPase [Blastocatellia bacterium]|nr:AAA family ATPase [Blastocatellia bacterium]
MAAQEIRTMKAAVGIGQQSEWISLNATRRCDEAAEFEQALRSRVVAQDNAIAALSELYQLYLAKLNMPGRPIGTLLFLGPTGSGKTRSVEAAAEALFGDPNAMIKIDCAEFQHSHEISKLVGSPPGYLGHRDTKPLLTQENLRRFQTPAHQLTLLLFDEIEKASDSLWQLLLGILDKATLTLGDNRRVDFSECIVVMTSNLGAREMSEVTQGRLGFAQPRKPSAALDATLEKIGIEAARRKFSPEFMNRLDKVVVFRSLTELALRRIIDLEIAAVQRRIHASGYGGFALNATVQVREFLIREGFDSRYGARPLKRAIEKYLVIPLSNLIATHQVNSGDFVQIDLDRSSGEVLFRKLSASAWASAATRLSEY